MTPLWPFPRRAAMSSSLTTPLLALGRENKIWMYSIPGLSKELCPEELSKNSRFDKLFCVTLEKVELLTFGLRKGQVNCCDNARSPRSWKRKSMLGDWKALKLLWISPSLPIFFFPCFPSHTLSLTQIKHSLKSLPTQTGMQHTAAKLLKKKKKKSI